MQYLTKNSPKHEYQLETEDRSLKYFDIFFASYDSTIVKAERVVNDKKTGQKSYWRAWFKLPNYLAIKLDVKNILSYPVSRKDPKTIQQFELWLEKCLLDESKWMIERTE